MADNINISPDMVNNLINMLKNSSNDQSTQNTQHETNTNQKDQYETNTNTNQYNTSSESDSSSVNIDFETIMKIKSIMETLNNSNDQDSKLLYSLKPYLRKSRQAKLDQYINILKITQISKFFNTKNNQKPDNNII